MVHGRKVSRNFRAGRRLKLTAFLVLVGAASIPAAFAQGGETQVAKTAPSTPAPVRTPVIPAPVIPVPAQAIPAPAPAVPSLAAKPVSPVGSGPAWDTGLAQQPPASAATQEAEMQLITKVNGYFNNMTEMEGNFIQTDPDNKRKRGRFYFARPGKMRFDYSYPTGLRIVSDGRYLAIEDHDMNTSEKYPLDVTPFKILMSETVDLARDARITSVEQGSDTIVITVEDKSGEASGRIRLFFNQADMSLKQWIISDAQGLDTRIEVSDLEHDKQVASNFFEISRMLGFDHDR